MRDFLLTSCPVFIWIISAIELVLLVLMYRRYTKTKKPMDLCMALITTGLFLDAFIITLGSVLTGSLLKGLSQIRFIAHGMLIPLLFPVCAYALSFKENWKKIVWIVTIALMIAGTAEGFSTVLEMKEIAGVTRYVSSDATPGWATAIASALSYGAVIPLIIAGIFVWVKQKTPYLFLSGFLMFAFSALGPATGNLDLIFFISMFGEVFMVLFLYLYSGLKSKNN